MQCVSGHIGLDETSWARARRAGIWGRLALPLQIVAVLGLLAPPVHGATGLGFPWVVICGAEGNFLYNLDTGERRDHDQRGGEDGTCHATAMRRSKSETTA